MVDSNMRNLGYGLFISGMMFAVLFAAKPVAVNEATDATPPTSDQTPSTFPDTWPLCALGLVGGVVGAGLIRRSRMAEAAKLAQHDLPIDSGETLESPADRLRGVATRIDAIKATTVDWIAPPLRQAIDRLLIEHVAPFSVGKDSLNSRFGMTRGAEILVAVAVGERMLNRAWSTSADGYGDEASQSIAEAQRAFEQAATLCTEEVAM